MKKEKVWWFEIDVIVKDSTYVFAETETEAFIKAQELFMKERDIPLIGVMYTVNI